MKMKIFFWMLSFLLISFNAEVEAKVLRGRCSSQGGHAVGLEALQQEAEAIEMSGDRYEEVALNPKLAVTDHDALSALKAREVFILIDQSASMNTKDSDPREQKPEKSKKGKKEVWTRWDSAQVATEGLAELALTLDANGEVPIYFFHTTGRFPKKTVVDKVLTHNMNEVAEIFSHRTPSGNTPLHSALKALYKDHLKQLLTDGKPFTVITLTDGAPDDEDEVISFLKTTVSQHKLTEKGKEHLAAFSFVQMGDNEDAELFLKKLDDQLEPLIGLDIVDTKKDNFIFGTDERFKDDCGPLAIFRDAIFD